VGKGRTGETAARYCRVFRRLARSPRPLVLRQKSPINYNRLVPRKPPLEDQLARLADLRSQPPSPEARVEVAGFLNARSNLLAAKAARIAGEWQATELIPELLSAFERFLVKPEVADKGCAAKTEIVKALCKLEHSSPSVFLRGMRHVQMEAVWGCAG
jgi:hypothetical protein